MGSSTADISAVSTRSVFLSRAINAVVRLQEGLSQQSLDEAVAAPTDYMVLVKALSAAPIVEELSTVDPLAAARLRGLERMKELVEAGGGLMRSEEVAKLLGLTRQAVDKRRAQKRLIGLTQGKRGYGYPRIQFAGNTTLPGLEEVLGELNASEGWSQLIFFVNPNDFLDGVTPAKGLRDGRMEDVKRAARTFGEQGAR